MTTTRRELLGTALVVGGAAALGARPRAALGDHAKPVLPASPSTSPAPAMAPPSSARAAYTVKPLPFDPTKLRGLSEKLLLSHHDNNYAAAVKNLNRVGEELARVGKDTPPFVTAGLRQSELAFTNSMILHEAYFSNLGGDGKAGGAIEKTLAEMNGGGGGFEEQFRAAAAGLAGGSGWVILAYNLHTNEPHIYTAINHTQSVAAGLPLLVLDMFEHAYQIDYGAAAAKYIDAFFQNVKWDEVERRLVTIRRAAAALR